MYISSRRKAGEKESIAGVTDDFLGEAVFVGELGSGKTTIIKELAVELGVSRNLVVSPTFILMQTHFGKFPLYHWDLYRLRCERDLYDLDYEEYFYGEGVCFIEWFDRLRDLLPRQCVVLRIHVVSERTRHIVVEGRGQRGKELVLSMKQQYERVRAD